MEHVPGKSINLAISIRGRSSLREVGLEDDIIKNHGLPMEARMIHKVDGSTYQIPYGQKGQVDINNFNWNGSMKHNFHWKKITSAFTLLAADLSTKSFSTVDYKNNLLIS